MKISINELHSLVDKALAKQGYTPSEASIIKDVLLYAQLRGNNQGVVKLIGAGIPKSPDAGEIKIIKQTNVSAFLDAHQAHAMIAVNQGVDIAINKAKEHGVGIVGIKGIGSSSGALGYYAKKIADQNLVGFICSGSMETVAAHGSSEAVLGTNPIAIALPSEADPLVFDMTTAAMAYFGVVEAATAGRQLPEGVAYDKDGNPSTDPKAVIDDGALKSFDANHKGSGLSIMIQALTGPLMGAYFTGFGDVVKNWGGHFIMAFDPELFEGAEATKTGITQMSEKIRSTTKLQNIDQIFVPGERGNKMTQRVLSSKEIEIEDNLFSELKKSAG